MTYLKISGNIVGPFDGPVEATTFASIHMPAGKWSIAEVLTPEEWIDGLEDPRDFNPERLI